MGNNNGACFHRHIGSLPFPSHLQLGKDATINMKTSITPWSTGSISEEAEVLYTVKGSECKLELRRYVRKEGNIKLVTFALNDSIICSDEEDPSLLMLKLKTDLLEVPHNFTSRIAWTKKRKNVDARGSVTDTKVYLYGTVNRCGLLVLECKKNDSHERDAKAVTIAHYFVSRKGSVAVNRSSQTKDIGFSVVAKVGVCDGKFDITVEGPEPHPVSALLYMFAEVNRTGIWKSSMCPHCRNIRREHSTTFLQSDSEDNDDGRRQNAVTIENTGSFRGPGCGARVGRDLNVTNNYLREDNNDVPFPRRLGSQRNAATIANNGRYTGDGNGSIINCKYLWFN
ncbi:hypothetical protein V8G54_011167 [Vigna mungo]|uniref:Uncharacterized protein n=1 Tax=Vigna mungo TaxID=3915 RepID=A0AAQ3NP56_VIGMU